MFDWIPRLRACVTTRVRAVTDCGLTFPAWALNGADDHVANHTHTMTSRR
jgi:hypothetical protein